MPNIREYDSEQALRGVQPSESGAEALNRAGRVISEYGRESGIMLGQAVSRVGQSVQNIYDKTQANDAAQEISTGSAALANVTNDLTKQWNQTANTTDLNDHTIAGKFTQDTLEPTLEKWQQGFQTQAGQKWAEQEAARLRDHFYTKTQADMSTRAGDALVANLNTTLNASASLARNDPSSMEHAIGLYKSSVDALVANLPDLGADAGTKARTEQYQKGAAEIAMSAGLGMAEKNPKALQDEIDKGSFDNYLSTQQIDQLEQHAQGQDKIKTTLVDRQSKDVASSYMLQSFDPSAQKSAPITVDDFAKVTADNRMRDEDKVALLKEMRTEYAAQQRELEGKVVSNPQVLSGFRARFAGNPSQYPTQQEIGTALGRGDLTRTDAGSLRESIEMLNGPSSQKDPATTKLLESAVKDAHAQLLGSAAPGDISPADQHAVSRFDAWFWGTYQQKTAQGASPQALLTPGSPDYLLNAENLAQFKTDSSDIVSSPSKPSGVAGGSVSVPIPPAQKTKSLDELWGGLGK